MLNPTGFNVAIEKTQDKGNRKKERGKSATERSTEKNTDTKTKTRRVFLSLSERFKGVEKRWKKNIV